MNIIKKKALTTINKSALICEGFFIFTECLSLSNIRAVVLFI